MNILEMEDLVKGVPDQRLIQEAQQPSGQLPQFLVMSELQRRQDMRKRFQAQQEQPQGTVKDQILREGIMASPQAPPTPPVPNTTIFMSELYSRCFSRCLTALPGMFDGSRFPFLVLS